MNIKVYYVVTTTTTLCESKPLLSNLFYFYFAICYFVLFNNRYKSFLSLRSEFTLKFADTMAWETDWLPGYVCECNG